MKKIIFYSLLSLCTIPRTHAQNWLASCQAATSANFLRSANSAPLPFKAKNSSDQALVKNSMGNDSAAMGQWTFHISTAGPLNISLSYFATPGNANNVEKMGLMSFAGIGVVSGTVWNWVTQLFPYIGKATKNNLLRQKDQS